MEVAFFGRGKVADRCRKVLESLDGISERMGILRGIDLGISVHWPYILGERELKIPRMGWVNVHNSYLPWNKGAHATTWAIIDQTPHGATMHWLDEGIDTGPLLYQERVEIADDDTADTLYQKTADAEVRVFEAGMKMILAGDDRRWPQVDAGSFHKKKDFDRLVRALTTSDCKVIREA